MNSITLIHSADWHLGARLCGQARDAEQRAFLDWMVDTLATEQPDILLLAGDIFDSATPPVAAQELYYHFLHRAARHCRHIVITGGNHDSAALLDAPRALLAGMQIHVIGATTAIEEEVLLLDGAQGTAIVAAVPYLRDRDVRQMQAGETLADKARAIADGIAAHYAQCAARAQTLAAGRDIPLIASGHLFAAGASSQPDDGMRDIHVGQLSHIPVAAFTDAFDYVALGHLHRAQSVGNQPHIRYSGAPLAMGFGDAQGERSLVRVTFTGKQAQIATIPVPCWQTLVIVRGSRERLQTQLQDLVDTGESVWVEAYVEAATFDSTLHERLQGIVAGSAVKLLRLHNAARRAQALHAQEAALPALDALNPAEVFAARLARDDALDDAAKATLSAAFAELLQQVESGDAH